MDAQKYWYDMSFVKATDKSSVIESFSRYSDIKKTGFYSMKFNGTSDEIDLMISDTVDRTEGTAYLWVYTGTTPGAGEDFLIGPMARLLEGVGAWGMGIAAVISRTSAAFNFQIVSLNSDSTSLTADETSDISAVLSDDTWYLIELLFEVDGNDCDITAKIYDEYLGTQKGSTLTHTYSDDSDTRGSSFGAIFRNDTEDCFVDTLSIVW